jgi:hypothetical protein
VATEIIDISQRLFRWTGATKQFPAGGNHFQLRRRTPETAHRYELAQSKRRQRRPNTGDSRMRSLSVFLALAFVLGGPTLAGTSDGGLPGIGTFGYQASPTLIAASALVVATH